LRTFLNRQQVQVPVTPREFYAQRWLHRVMQNDIPLPELRSQFAGRLKPDDVMALVSRIKTGALRERNKAVAILAFNKPVSMRLISRFLLLALNTVSRWRNQFRNGGLSSVFRFRSRNPKKSDLSEYREAVFSILHAPPSAYGFNRNSWRMEDIVRVLRDRGLRLCKDHCHPVEATRAGWKFLNPSILEGGLGVIDLNAIPEFSPAGFLPVCRHARWQDGFCSSHRMDPRRAVSPLR
jgi:transposase